LGGWGGGRGFGAGLGLGGEWRGGGEGVERRWRRDGEEVEKCECELEKERIGWLGLDNRILYVKNRLCVFKAILRGRKRVREGYVVDRKEVVVVVVTANID